MIEGVAEGVGCVRDAIDPGRRRRRSGGSHPRPRRGLPCLGEPCLSRYLLPVGQRQRAGAMWRERPWAGALSDSIDDRPAGPRPASPHLGPCDDHGGAVHDSCATDDQGAATGDYCTTDDSCTTDDQGAATGDYCTTDDSCANHDQGAPTGDYCTTHDYCTIHVVCADDVCADDVCAPADRAIDSSAAAVLHAASATGVLTPLNRPAVPGGRLPAGPHHHNRRALAIGRCAECAGTVVASQRRRPLPQQRSRCLDQLTPAATRRHVHSRTAPDIQGQLEQEERQGIHRPVPGHDGPGRDHVDAADRPRMHRSWQAASGRPLRANEPDDKEGPSLGQRAARRRGYWEQRGRGRR